MLNPFRIALAVLALANPLFSQIPDMFQFAIHVGATIPAGPWGNQANTSERFGLGCHYKLNKSIYFGLDLSFDQRELRPSIGSGNEKVSSLNVTPEMKFLLGGNAISSYYAIIGIGQSRVSSKYGYTTEYSPFLVNVKTTPWTTNRPTFHVGGGAVFASSKNYQLFVECRYQRIQTPGIAINEFPITAGIVW